MAAAHEMRLLVAALLAIAAVVVLVSKFRVHAFLALLIAALGMGLGAGLDPNKVITAIGTGFGQIMGGVGAVVGLGAMLGALVLGSGGAERLASAVLKICGPKGAPWIIAGVAMLVGAPLFFETGLVLMMPIIVALGARLEEAQPGSNGGGYVRAAVPALSGLSVMHGLVPPHPGPLIAITALGAPLGRTFLIGAAMAIPVVIVSGPLLGDFIWRFAHARPVMKFETVVGAGQQKRQASLGATLFALLLPGVLILGKTVADLVLPSGDAARMVADIAGAPTIALLISVLIALVTLGLFLGLDSDTAARRAASGVPAIAGLLLIIGGGGAFKQVLVDSGVGAVLAGAAASAHLSPILVGWLLAVSIRLATGSATVATTTAAGVMASAMHGMTGVDPAILALAIGGGSLFLSHVNDAGFWMVREFLGLSMADTFKTWSLTETIVSVMVLGLALGAAAVL